MILPITTNINKIKLNPKASKQNKYTTHDKRPIKTNVPPLLSLSSSACSPPFAPNFPIFFPRSIVNNRKEIFTPSVATCVNPNKIKQARKRDKYIRLEDGAYKKYPRILLSHRGI